MKNTNVKRKALFPEYLCIQVEAVQKRALRIICKNVSYSENMESTGIVSLKDRGESLCRKYFNRINKPSNRIFNLLPSCSEHQYNLRNNRLPSIKAKTERFRNSFIPYAHGQISWLLERIRRLVH